MKNFETITSETLHTVIGGQAARTDLEQQISKGLVEGEKRNPIDADKHPIAHEVYPVVFAVRRGFAFQGGVNNGGLVGVIGQ